MYKRRNSRLVSERFLKSICCGFCVQQMHNNPQQIEISLTQFTHLTQQSTPKSAVIFLTNTTGRSANADWTARPVCSHLANGDKTRMLPSVAVGVSAFRPKFYGNGVLACQNVDVVLQLCRWKFLDNETL